jgi:hypothetical protein
MHERLSRFASCLFRQIFPIKATVQFTHNISTSIASKPFHVKSHEKLVWQFAHLPEMSYKGRRPGCVVDERLVTGMGIDQPTGGEPYGRA